MSAEELREVARIAAIPDYDAREAECAAAEHPADMDAGGICPCGSRDYWAEHEMLDGFGDDPDV